MTQRRVSLERVSNISIGLTLAAAAGGAIAGVGHALSIAAGGAFMLADFHLIRLLVSLLIRAGASSWTRAVALLALTLKFLLVMVLVAGVFYQFPVAPLSFALGASTLLVASVLEATLLGEPVGPVREPRCEETVKE